MSIEVYVTSKIWMKTERLDARGSKILNLQDRKDRDELFVICYVANGGNATQAVIDCGVSNASAGTVGHRLKNRLSKEIEEGQKAALQDFSVKAVHALGDLLKNCNSSISIILGAIPQNSRQGRTQAGKQAGNCSCE